MNTGSEWLGSVRRLVDVVTTSLAADGGDAASDHGSDCRWCPVCQAAAVVRGERPEVTAALADVLTATSTALRAFADPGEDGTAAAEESPPEDESPPEAQQIDIV